MQRNNLDYLVVFHLVTTGKQNEELGCDEMPIAMITFLIHDVINNRVVSVKQQPVTPIINPRHAETENETGPVSLTEDCQQETGLSDEVIRNAPLLENALEEVNRFLSQKIPEGKRFILVTESQLPLRLCLHPETCGKRIDIKTCPYYYQFYDLRKEFQRMYKSVKLDRLQDMLEFLEITADASVEYGDRKCQDMSRIISRLLIDGHKFEDPDKINEFYHPAIVRKTDVVDDDVVVRARGLPWQATDSDINRFFRGLNIEHGGIGLVLSKVGRRNGEALIRFVDREHRDLAIRKHKHHMGQRYIEVYMATGRDFIAVAGGETKEAEDFLSKLTDPGQTLVRMRGLPYTATPEEIIKFFEAAECPVQFGAEGILFVNHPDGRATGDAFVIFPDEDFSERALQSHRQHIGSRYIELFKSTPAEVNQVMNGMLAAACSPATTAALLQGLAAAGGTFDLDMSYAAAMGLLPPAGGPLMGPPPLLHTGAQFAPPPHPNSLLSSPGVMSSLPLMNPKSFIRIKGMPIDAQAGDILVFLDVHSNSIVLQGVHLVYNTQGQPAGEAIIQMISEIAATAAVVAKHKTMFYLSSGKRSQVDVLHCGPSEVPHLSGLVSPLTAPGHHHPFLHRPALYPHQHPGGGLPTVSALSTYPYVSVGAPALFTTAGPHTPPHLQPRQYAHAPLFYNYQSNSPTWPYQQAPLPGHPGMAANNAYYLTAASLQLGMPTLPGSTNGTTGHAMATVIAKGLPKDAGLEEILGLMDSVINNGIVPEVKIGLTQDGIPSGEAFISFLNRNDAERAATQGNRKMLRNHCVEMLVAPSGIFAA